MAYPYRDNYRSNEIDIIFCYVCIVPSLMHNNNIDGDDDNE